MIQVEEDEKKNNTELKNNELFRLRVNRETEEEIKVSWEKSILFVSFQHTIEIVSSTPVTRFDQSLSLAVSLSPQIQTPMKNRVKKNEQSR